MTRASSCHDGCGPGRGGTHESAGRNDPRLRFALAGNANVGKSVIFNHLTKLHQHIGNWPGKTVERAEGTFHFMGHDIDIIDLPGIYSVSTYSIEEDVAREYLAVERPDVIIDVVDASVLERNLYLTLQLMEFGIPMVLVLNQVDMAEKKGIRIDCTQLEKRLGIPVVPAVAVNGTGIYEAMKRAIDVHLRGKTPGKITYGREIENGISRIEKIAPHVRDYAPRWVAIKILEEDAEVSGMVGRGAMAKMEKIKKEIEKLHDHPCQTVMASEKYAVACGIAEKVQKKKATGRLFSTRFSDLLIHRVWGYPIMATVIAMIFLSLFSFGNFLSELIGGYSSYLLGSLQPDSGIILSIVFWFMEGLVAAVTVVIPYILPFYVILGLLEDSGYMARMAFLMDSAMHKMGLHGKAFIPLMMGYGCNVPACIGCRVMETQKERLIAIFVTTFIPCAAVTAVVLGVVSRFVGVWWAAALYILDFALMLALGKIAFMVFPGESVGLIMEIPEMRMPHLKTTAREAWFKMQDFIRIAFPILIVSTVTIKLAEASGLLVLITGAMYPLTVSWLGLPAVLGIAFIFGILRKELTIVMLVALLGTANLAAVLTPVQMLVFTMVTMLYIPCAATIAALVKEIGWKKAALITIFKIFFAIAVGGIFMRILLLFT